MNTQLFTLLEGKPEAQFGMQDYYATMSNAVQESLLATPGTCNASDAASVDWPGSPRC